MRFFATVVAAVSLAAFGQVERVNVDGLGRAAAFSHATVSGDLIFVSGTLPTQGETFELVEGDIGVQTRQTLSNIQRILAGVGAAMNDVLKCNVYLIDMNDFAAMNEAYLKFFPDGPPARTTVGVAQLALGARIEIEAVAQRPKGESLSMRDVFRTAGFVESGGEQIYYESFGEGPVVVLSHGLGGNHAIWYQQVPVFAQEFRVITWDQRGFGRSSNTRNESSPKAAALDLAAILDHLGIGKAHLVGQSMGGWAVMGFALAHPERVSKLVLADTIGGIYTPEIERHFDAYIRAAGQGPAPDALPITRHPAIGESIGVRDPAQAFLYSQIGSTAAPAPANMGLLLRTTAYERAKIEALEVETLCVVGEDDPIFPPAVIREAASVLPNARVVELPGAGHSPYFETPAAWNASVLEFLSGR